MGRLPTKKNIIGKTIKEETEWYKKRKKRKKREKRRSPHSGESTLSKTLRDSPAAVVATLAAPATIPAGYIAYKEATDGVPRYRRVDTSKKKDNKKSKSRKNRPDMYPPPKGKKSLTKKMKATAEKIPTTQSYKKKKRNEKIVTGVGRKPTYKDRD